MFRSENRAAAATLVDRNGGVLDEELVAFGAPDKPQVVSFHGHGFPVVYQLRRLDARRGVKWHQYPFALVRRGQEGMVILFGCS